MKALLLLLLFIPSGSSASVLVTLDEGILQGTTYTFLNGKVANAFFGIPYAVPPVYQNRFKPPIKAKPWKGVFNASTLPSSCLQYEDVSFSVIGQEDCLYLNVFTPKLPMEQPEHEKLFDVLIFIHGGGFMFGNGQHRLPKYIMKDNDIVFVSLNYRLGILGFMSTGDSIVPGNNGLKDQLLALKWVKKNIEKFGGNPNSITLAGSSAGGASVHYHLLSDASNGLFNRGLSFSGSVLPPWTLPRNNTEKSIHVAAMAGCPPNDIKIMIDCLRQRPAQQIVELSRYFQTFHYDPFTSFGPTVESQNEHSFLTEKPIDVLRRGGMKDLPWLVSLCKDEGLFRAADFITDEKTMLEIERRWDEIAPQMFMYNFSVATEEEKNEISKAIKEYYFHNRPVSESIKEFMQLSGDRAFFNDITRAIKLQASFNKRNVYCYKFSYRGKYSVSNMYTKNLDDYGVSHADDVDYIVTLNTMANAYEADSAMVDFMAQLVKNFMKTGFGNVDGIEWQPVSKNIKDKLRCLEIHSVSKQEMIDYEDTRTLKFWANLLPRDFPELTSATMKNEL